MRKSCTVAMAAMAILVSSCTRAPSQKPGGMAARFSDKYYTIIPRGTEPKLLIDGSVLEPGLTMTEGPAWMDGTLYFSNYYMFHKPWGSSEEGGPIAMKPDGSFRVLNKNLQTNGIMPLGNGYLAVCDIRGHSVIEMTPQGEVVRTLADTYNGVRLDGPNDLVIDAKGGIYFTDPQGGRDEKMQSGPSVYYLTPAGKLIRMIDPGVHPFPNGCLLSADGTIFYLCDPNERYVWMYDVNRDGTLTNKRAFAELRVAQEPGKKSRASGADGMTIDIDGNLYVTSRLGIQIIDRTGDFVGIIRLPKQASNCVFGGPELKTLYATCRDQIYAIKTNAVGLQYPLK